MKHDFAKASSRQAALLFTLAIVAGTVALSASDRTGIYAIVDKVVFEPNAENPERVQIWGAFAVATRGDKDLYDPIQRGYLYFTAEGPPRIARAEWNDLKSVAGTRQIVAFSARFGQSLHVRPESEKPQGPDKYVTDIGVRKIPVDRDYAPIKALSAYASR